MQLKTENMKTPFYLKRLAYDLPFHRVVVGLFIAAVIAGIVVPLYYIFTDGSGGTPTPTPGEDAPVTSPPGGSDDDDDSGSTPYVPPVDNGSWYTLEGAFGIIASIALLVGIFISAAFGNFVRRKEIIIALFSVVVILAAAGASEAFKYDRTDPNGSKGEGSLPAMVLTGLALGLFSVWIGMLIPVETTRVGNGVADESEGGLTDAENAGLWKLEGATVLSDESDAASNSDPSEVGSSARSSLIP